MWLTKRGLGGAEGRLSWKGVSEIYKNLHLIILEGVLINGNKANGLQFFLRIGITPTSWNKVKQSNTKKRDYIFKEPSIYI